MEFGSYLRERRRARQIDDPSFSVRGLAGRIGVEPSFLSKVERGEAPPPSEEKILRLAAELDENPDFLLALGGKVASDLQAIIRKRPALFGRLLRELRDQPYRVVQNLVRTAGPNKE